MQLVNLGCEIFGIKTASECILELHRVMGPDFYFFFFSIALQLIMVAIISLPFREAILKYN